CVRSSIPSSAQTRTRYFRTRRCASRRGRRGAGRRCDAGAPPVSDWATIVGDDFAAPGGPDDRVDGVVPRWVIRPGSVAEVQAAVRSGGALVASGLGAPLDIAAPPRRLEVLGRLDRLDRGRCHQAAGTTVTLGAGRRL